MNHVGWYVPASAAELEQLDGLVPAFDPDLPRLHGALPGPYLRYYAHPDRMLTAQRGRPTRADQLRELADSTLATFGRGDIPPAWRRPAPWYSLAVVPLIDSWLTGPGSTLILGLPNRGRLGWLPDDVIVEGPANMPVRGPAEALPVAELPDLPRGILARHAAYERLAATTLAAGPPADEDMHKILLANPMVTSLDQARAVTGAIISRMSAYDPQWR
jgi:6-phospho-beta-glucosidase